ncbi:MAG TPA: hypothetical protein EYN66_05480 [Myxococcales bacterium]|nr:hypothetical protein [Myxococcales bacterium]
MWNRRVLGLVLGVPEVDTLIRLKASTRSLSVVTINVTEPQESYQILTLDAESPLKSNRETWFYSFFSTQGKFTNNAIKSSGKATVEWSLDKDELTEVPVWIVVRDGRGGTNWCHSKF